MRKIKIKFLIRLYLTASFLAAGLAAIGQEQEIGPAIGQRAPAFTLKDQNDKEVSLDALLKKGPVALVFVRSADWCSFCKLQLVQLQRNLKEIESSGGQVVSISYDSTKALKTFADRKKIAFLLLSDSGSKTIDAYDMRNKQAVAAQDGSSNHGAFIIDQQGVIRARFSALSDSDRALVDELVKALKEAQNLDKGTKQ